MTDLEDRVAAQRLVLDHILTLAPEAVLRRWMESAERIAGGGDTHPVSTEADRRAAAIEMSMYEDALARLDEMKADMP